MPKYVGQLGDCKQARARPDQAGCRVAVDHAVSVQRQNHQFQAATLSQLLPWQQIGVVFQRADGDFVARSEFMFQPVGQQVQRRRCAVGEDDLAVLAGIQPVGGLATAGLERLSGVRAGQMLGTMHVGGTVGIVMSQGVDQRLRLLRRGGVVQIGLALPLQSGEGGEVAAPWREEGHCSSSVWRRVQSHQP